MTWQRHPFQRRSPHELQPETLLHDAFDALRLGRLGEVLKRANLAGDNARNDAKWLNLLGIVHESLGHLNDAKRFYGRAMRRDHRFAPAEQNMRRLYERAAFGKSTQAVCVGESFTDLWLAQRCKAPGAAR